MRIVNASDQVERVAVGDLLPHPRNPNQGDVGAIAESIDANGWFGVVLAQTSTRRVIAGEHRWRAATAAGADTVPVLFLDVDDDEAERIMLADNALNRERASWEPGGLAELLVELQQRPRGLVGTGFDADDLDAMLARLNVSADQVGGARDGMTPQERADSYGASAIRSLILSYGLDEYERIILGLARLRAHRDLPSNAAVVEALIVDALAAAGLTIDDEEPAEA